MARHLRFRRATQHGFTLLEMLVVVIVLGILAAVVVFAVRGSGDKGRGAAVGTDERIIRTALEVYCARNGHYPAEPAMKTLVDGRFLSSASEYNVVSTGDQLPQGSCPGSPKHYALTLQLPPSVAGWAKATAPQKGAAPDNDRNMVQLPDGRVFTGAELFDPSDGLKGSWRLATPNALSMAHEAKDVFGTPDYYPRLCGSGDAQGTQGLLCGYDSPNTMVVIAGAGASCTAGEAEYCGKVLSFIPDRNLTGEWELFDPTVAGSGCAGRQLCQPTRDGPSGPIDIGQWSVVRRNGPASDTDDTRIHTRAVQIGGTRCGPSCGKVLMVNSPKLNQAELWNPKAWHPHADPATSFRSLGVYDPSGTPTYNAEGNLYPLLQALPSGEALLIAGTSAWVFNPSSEKLEPVAPPASAHQSDTDESSLLADGRVMVTSNHANELAPDGRSASREPADVFDPATRTWSTAPTCGVTNASEDQSPSTDYSQWFERSCHLLSGLPGGRVLAWTGAGVRRDSAYKGRTYVFDPQATTWSRQPDLNTKMDLPENSSSRPTRYSSMPSGGLLLSGSACGASCGKVLAVNVNPCCPGFVPLAAELFTPASGP